MAYRAALLAGSPCVRLLWVSASGNEEATASSGLFWLSAIGIICSSSVSRLIRCATTMTSIVMLAAAELRRRLRLPLRPMTITAPLGARGHGCRISR